MALTAYLAPFDSCKSVNSRKTSVVVIGKWPFRSGSLRSMSVYITTQDFLMRIYLELNNLHTFCLETPWKTTLPSKSKPRRPARPAHWR